MTSGEYQKGTHCIAECIALCEHLYIASRIYGLPHGLPGHVVPLAFLFCLPNTQAHSPPAPLTSPFPPPLAHSSAPANSATGTTHRRGPTTSQLHSHAAVFALDDDLLLAVAIAECDVAADAG
jgi:hypothetical protein